MGWVPANTKFEVALADSVSSKTHKQDQIIYFKMVSNFIVNNVVVIPKDTMGKAIIVEATKPGGFGRAGTLTFEARSIPTINNVEVPLSATIKGQGNSDGGAVAVAVALSLIGGMFMKGTNISYPAGTPFTVTVVRDTDLNTTAENLASVMDLSKPQGNSIQVTAKQL